MYEQEDHNSPGRTYKDYKSIISLILRSFQEGTDYSDGADIVALVEEIRDSEYYIPELSFVAELNNTVVGHFLFSRFPLSPAKEGGHGDAANTEIVMLAPVSVHGEIDVFDAVVIASDYL